MYKIVDKQNNHQPVKSGFLTTTQALKWAKKNLPENTFQKFGKASPNDRYFIYMY